MGKIKAYSVSETDDYAGVIVFAASVENAERRGSIELFDEEGCEVLVQPAPWADRYRGRPIPAAAMIRAGWTMECHGCSISITEDLAIEDIDDRVAEGLVEAGRYRDWTPDHAVGFHKGANFCDARCQHEHEEMERKRERLRQRAIERFSSILLTRLPDVEIVDRPHEYGGNKSAYYDIDNGVWLLHAVTIPFTYPGAEHGYAAFQYQPRDGQQTDRSLHFVCPNGDAEAFRNYCDAHLRAV